MICSSSRALYYLLGCYVVSIFFLRLTIVQPFNFWTFFLFASFSFFALLFLIRKAQNSSIKISLARILCGSFLLRVLFWSEQSILSNDVYRYIWDGLVLLEGLHPWEVAPNTVDIGTSVIPPDHRSVTSLYPPIALAMFSGLVSISTSKLIFSIAFSLMDLVTITILHKVLVILKRNPINVLFYAWHPLVLIEGTYSAHVDLVAIPFLSLAIFLCIRRKWGVEPMLIVLSLIKLWPLVLLVGRVREGWKKNLPLAYLCLGIFLYFFWFFPSLPELSGLGMYLRHWEFNGFAYAILDPFFDSTLSRLISVSCMIAVIIVLGRKHLVGSDFSFQDTAFCLVAAYILLSPVVYPWYALWIFPFLVLSDRWEWKLFTLSVLASYEVVPDYLRNGEWIEEWWVWWLCYGPILLGCAACLSKFLMKKVKIANIGVENIDAKQKRNGRAIQSDLENA